MPELLNIYIYFNFGIHRLSDSELVKLTPSSVGSAEEENYLFNCLPIYFPYSFFPCLFCFCLLCMSPWNHDLASTLFGTFSILIHSVVVILLNIFMFVISLICGQGGHWVKNMPEGKVRPGH